LKPTTLLHSYLPISRLFKREYTGSFWNSSPWKTKHGFVESGT
ncbi:hypothetical protein T02_3162, partial [Trichinella nativa]